MATLRLGNNIVVPASRNKKDSITITHNGLYDVADYDKAIVYDEDAIIGEAIRNNNDYKKRYNEIVPALNIKYPEIVGWLYCQTTLYNRSNSLQTTLILQGADSYWIDNEKVYAYENGDTTNPITYVLEDGTTYEGTRNFTVVNKYDRYDLFYGYVMNTTSDFIRSTERKIYCHYCEDAIIPTVRTENVTEYVYGGVNLNFKEGYRDVNLRFIGTSTTTFSTNAKLTCNTEMPNTNLGRYVIGGPTSLLLYVDASDIETFRYGSFLAGSVTINKISFPNLKHLGAANTAVLSQGYMALCSNCSALQEINLPQLEDVNMNLMWRGAIAYNCNSLKKLSCPNLIETTDGLGDAGCLIGYCANLEEIDLPSLVNFSASSSLFIECPNMKVVNVPNLKTITLTGTNYESFINYRYGGNTLIEELNFPSLESYNMDYRKYLVVNCSQLKRVILPSLKSSPATMSLYYTTPLQDCPNVEYIYLGCKGATNQTVGFGSNVELTNCTDVEIGEGARQNIVLTGGINNLTRDNIVNHIFNRLADNTDGTALRIRLGATNLARLSEEDKAIAINKNYTLA